MGPHQHANIVKVLGAFTRKDGRAAGQNMVNMHSDSGTSYSKSEELFIKGVEQICVMDSNQNFIDNVGDYVSLVKLLFQSIPGSYQITQNLSFFCLSFSLLTRHRLHYHYPITVYVD